jgi:hypothetical protein
LAALAALTVVPQPAAGEDWMFRRSYFSHEVPPELKEVFPVPESRSAYRRAYVGGRYGIAIRGGYRYNSVYLQSGSSVDYINVRENWVEVVP